LQASADLEYLFRHALTHEAAYDSLTRRQRVDLHGAIGEILERLYPERQEELADILAYHFGLAGQPARAAQYALVAARRAAATYAFDEAVLHLQRAIEIVGDGPPHTRLELSEALGDIFALKHLGPRAIGAYQVALEACRLAPSDEVDAIRLHRKVLQTGAETKYAVGREGFRALHTAMQASEASLEETLEELRHRPPHPETVRLLAVLSTAAWRMRTPPDWATALGYAEDAVRMAEALAAPVELSVALEALTSATCGQGMLQESRDAALRRLAVTRAPDFLDERERLDALRGAGAGRVYLGEYEEAIPLLLEAEHFANRVQAVDQVFNALALLTLCWLRLDRWDEIQARRDVWEDLEKQYPQERTGPLCWPIGLRAVVETLTGDAAAGARLRDQSLAIMESTFGQTEWLRNAHY
jgi:tetratricopeptide (TPR) repeat protein